MAVIHATQRMTEMTDIKHWLSAVFKLLMYVVFKCWLTVLRRRFLAGLSGSLLSQNGASYFPVMANCGNTDKLTRRNAV